MKRKLKSEIFPLGGCRGGGGDGEPGYQWWDHHYSLISPPTPPPAPPAAPPAPPAPAPPPVLSLSLSAPENLSLTAPGDVQSSLIMK